LERVVLEVERRLSGIESRKANPAIGSDVKVMGVRQRERITLTIGCAFVARHVASLDEYVRKKEAARTLVMEVARRATMLHVEATLNAADDLSRGDVYLTVTGTSAEAGDDGEVGRGNRTSGLITPYRFMTMEAAAGKNPMNHVGKLYNVVADRIAAELVTGVDGVRAAACVLVSQIGHVIDDPQVADIRLSMNETTLIDRVRAQTETVVHDQLRRLSEIRQALLDEHVTVY
jgi:S-adenosylmethionine synthetase